MAKRSKPADTLRHAVDQTFQVAAGQAQTTRDRAQELVDELAHTAGRLRGVLEDIRPAGSEDVRALRVELDKLERRVRALEQRAATSRGGSRSPTPGRAAPGRTAPGRARSGGT